jgi:DNA helicase MCM9
MDINSEAFEKLLKDPKQLPPASYVGLLKEFLLTYRLDRIEQLLLLERNDQFHSLEVDYRDFESFDGCLSLLMVSHVSLLMPMFDSALKEVMESVGTHTAFVKKHGRRGTVKDKVTIRLFCLPANNHHITKQSIGNLKASETRQFLQFTGTVVKTGPVRMLEASKTYRCRKCGHEFQVRADPEQNNTLAVPMACPNWIENHQPATAVPQAQAQAGGSLQGFMSQAAAAMRGQQQQQQQQQPGGATGARTSGGVSRTKCPGKQLIEVEHLRVMVDYQEVKVQDLVEKLALGTTPRSVKVVCEGDLVDRFNAGDDVVVVGSIIREWKPVFPGQRVSVDVAVKANSVVSSDHHKNQHRSVDGTDVQRFVDFWAARSGSNGSGGDGSYGLQEEDEGARRKLLPGEIAGRDRIIASVCPMLYGLYYVKLALLLTLIGGTTTAPSSSSSSSSSSDSSPDPAAAAASMANAPALLKVRQQAHLLLVGDPGCGKSQLLKFAATLVPRSVTTTGIGTSGAGLTATAVKEGSEYVVEAGALVLANDGVCCIDEFSSIKKDDRGTIHEAMEQQTISLAKAGLVVKLNARASVIACCNPKGNYDTFADITTNTAISASLLSRFDLVVVLLDNPNKDWDKRVSTYLLSQAIKDGNIAQGKAVSSSSTQQRNRSAPSQQQQEEEEDKQHSSRGNCNSNSLDDGACWSVDTLRLYLSHIKYGVQSRMTPAAACLLKKYYTLQRQSDGRSAARTTTRLLESLVRLSESHAKLMHRRWVLIEDAVAAIALMAMSGGGGGAASGLFMSDGGSSSSSSSSSSSNSLAGGLGDVSTTSGLLQSTFPPEGQEYAHYLTLERRVLALLHESRESLLGSPSAPPSNGGGGGGGDRTAAGAGNNVPPSAPAALVRPPRFDPNNTGGAAAFNSYPPHPAAAAGPGNPWASSPPLARVSVPAAVTATANANNNVGATDSAAYDDGDVWGARKRPAPLTGSSGMGSLWDVNKRQAPDVGTTAANVDVWGASNGSGSGAGASKYAPAPAAAVSVKHASTHRAAIHNPSFFDVNDDDW